MPPHSAPAPWRRVTFGPTRLELRVRFVAQGFRWPLRDGDTVEVWDGMRHECVGTITGAMVRHLVAHHLSTVHLQAQFTAELTRPVLSEAPPRKALAKVDGLPWSREERAAKRARRRTP